MRGFTLWLGHHPQRIFSAVSMIPPVSFQSSPDTFAVAQAGMQRGLAQFNHAADLIAGGGIDPGNVVEMMQGQRLYELNAKLLRTGDEMLGTLLNVMA